METKYFSVFIRTLYKNIEISNKQCLALGEEFKKYLEEKMKGKEKTLEKIWDISPLTIIMNQKHPFKVNGYDPAFVFHFTNFTEENVKKAEDEIDNSNKICKCKNSDPFSSKRLGYDICMNCNKKIES